MVVDTSAIIAILTGETDSGPLVEALDQSDSLQISAASVLETGIVIEARHGERGRKMFDRWLEESSINVIPLNRTQVEAAREGFRRFGKGRHPAALNFGDCFSYGLAKTLGEPLLFCGNDFTKTDLRSALSLYRS